MKLKKTFISHCVNGESVLVPAGNSTGFYGMVRGDNVFGEILNLLQKETTEQEIIAALKSHYHAADGAIEQDVKRAITGLREIGAIDD